jgi:hypothetical protein
MVVLGVCPRNQAQMVWRQAEKGGLSVFVYTRDYSYTGHGSARFCIWSRRDESMCSMTYMGFYLSYQTPLSMLLPQKSGSRHA